MADLTLVTGATGFIGSHVVAQLLGRGEAVRVLVRDPAKLADVGLAEQRNLDVVRGDLLAPDTLDAALEGVRRVYHVAGFISTARRDRDAVHRLNYDITANLFTAIERASVDKVVYLASIFALGGPDSTDDTRPVREDVAYNLDGLDVEYVRAKRQAELYAYECRDRGMPIVFVYPCFCYGPGDVYVSSSRPILQFLRRQVPIYTAGGQNVMDVRDAAAGLILGMDKGKVGSKYIIGGSNMSYRELFGTLSSITGLQAPLVRAPRPLVRLAGRLVEQVLARSSRQQADSVPIDEQSSRMLGYHWYYDDGKARRELGYTSRPVPLTLWDAIHWFCERGMAPVPPGLSL